MKRAMDKGRLTESNETCLKAERFEKVEERMKELQATRTGLQTHCLHSAKLRRVLRYWKQREKNDKNEYTQKIERERERERNEFFVKRM